MKSYRGMNLAAGLLHLVQGITVLLLSNDFSLPVTTSFLQMDPGTQRLQPVPETLIDLRIGPLVAVFLFLSAAAHLLIAAPGIHDRYRSNLARGINPARWIEYSLSASVMIVVIAMLVGIFDIVSLILLFSVNATMILFGWLMETANEGRDRVSWLPFWFGSFAGAIPWVAVGIYLVGAGSGGEGPPAFVYWIYFSIFLFFNVFAVNMALQYKKVGPWRDYLYGERAYILLSLIAKSLLAWQVFGGTLRPV